MVCIHVLLSTGSVSQLPILSMTPTYARRVSPNKMMHIPWIHAPYIPTTIYQTNIGYIDQNEVNKREKSVQKNFKIKEL